MVAEPQKFSRPAGSILAVEYASILAGFDHIGRAADLRGQNPDPSAENFFGEGRVITSEQRWFDPYGVVLK